MFVILIPSFFQYYRGNYLYYATDRYMYLPFIGVLIMIAALLLRVPKQRYTAMYITSGIVLSVLLIYVINFQSFGWTIQFRMPWGFLAQSLAFVVVATVAAGLYPAALALKMDPIKGIRAE